MFDVCLAAPLLLLFAPVMAVLAVLVWLGLGRPVLFRQERPGLRGELFILSKFRTMTERRDADGQLLTDDQRLNRFGRLLRRTSLDELPTLFNVLRGEMSMVGPRPLLVQYLALYSPQQRRRHRVRPGVTGWAQVNGRNALDWDRRLALDVYYADHLSWWLDIRILARTIWMVLSREGITFPGQATMHEFRGTDPSSVNRPGIPR